MARRQGHGCPEAGAAPGPSPWDHQGTQESDASLLGVEAFRLLCRQVPDPPLSALRGARPSREQPSSRVFGGDGGPSESAWRGRPGRAPHPREGVGARAPPRGPPAPPAAPGAQVICVGSWSPSPYRSLTPCHMVPSLVIPEPSTVVPHPFPRSPRRPQGLGCLSQVSPQPPKPQPWGQRSPSLTRPEGLDGRLMGEAGLGPGASPAHRLRGGGRQADPHGAPGSVCGRTVRPLGWSGACVHLCPGQGVGSPRTQPRMPETLWHVGAAGGPCRARGLLPSCCVRTAAGAVARSSGVTPVSQCPRAEPARVHAGSSRPVLSGVPCCPPGSAWALTTRSGAVTSIHGTPLGSLSLPFAGQPHGPMGGRSSTLCFLHGAAPGVGRAPTSACGRNE